MTREQALDQARELCGIGRRQALKGAPKYEGMVMEGFPITTPHVEAIADALERAYADGVLDGR